MEEAVLNAAAAMYIDAPCAFPSRQVQEAISADDYGVAALEAAMLACNLSDGHKAVVEGLKARAHKRGRKPSGKTGGKAPMPKVKSFQDRKGADGSGDEPIQEGTAQNSADATINAMATPVRVITVSGMPDDQRDDVAEIARDHEGHATDGEGGVTVRFTVGEMADQFLATLKERIPSAKTSVSESADYTAEAVPEYCGRLRIMPLDEFTAHIEQFAALDSDDAFAARVKAVVEAYKGCTGKKDMARKITAVNPIIKKRAGKGINMEAIDNATVQVRFTHNQLNEFLVLAGRAGAEKDTPVEWDKSGYLAVIPEAVASKLRPVFHGDGITYADA
jgi:methylmalonyl-CoA mutase cobalamin-binding subunit